MNSRRRNLRTAVAQDTRKLRRRSLRVPQAGAIDNRSVAGQIEHWAKIGKCAEENPDLTYALIREILMGIEELEQGESSEYDFG